MSSTLLNAAYSVLCRPRRSGRYFSIAAFGSDIHAIELWCVCRSLKKEAILSPSERRKHTDYYGVGDDLFSCSS